ncbi:KilA-N domain-containing protein [Chitiniphilus eburneus]|uniref:KilA-N domain-containing protein n=1 Tax=Chitiniphilus eburneus TaxID=2571148 RepID=UPI0035CF49CA
MDEVTIAGVSIRQDSEGRFSFNDLHDAAVAAGHDYKACQVEHFTRNDSTQALIDELRKNGELEIDPYVSRAGRYGGTWGCKELVYAYAMWISAAFHLKVIRVFDAMVSRQQVSLAVSPYYDQIPRTLPEALRLAAVEMEKNAALIEQKARVERERDVAVATKARIGAKREATAMNTAAQATKRANQLEQELDRSQQYATIKRMEAVHRGMYFSWRVLKRVSGELGLQPASVFDSNYGCVKSYHRSVWLEAYGLDILSSTPSNAGGDCHAH